MCTEVNHQGAARSRYVCYAYLCPVVHDVCSCSRGRRASSHLLIKFTNLPPCLTPSSGKFTLAAFIVRSLTFILFFHLLNWV